MSEICVLLRLLHDAHGKLHSFQAEYRDWLRPRPTAELVVHPGDSDDGRARVHWRGAGPFPEKVTSTRRIWLQGADKRRVEFLRAGQLMRLGVLGAERWWRWDRDEGVASGQLRPDPGRGWVPPPPLLSPPLINPASLLATLRFEDIGSYVRVGRAVITAQGVPRRATPVVQALRYEFEFDAEHGTILRRAAFEDGRAVRLTEAVAVAYDRPVQPERFVFISPEG